MSAWVVSKPNIDCLIQALIVEGDATFDQADELGRTLWNECADSVSYRYDDIERPGGGDWPGPIGFSRQDVADYRYVGVEAPLDDAVVLMAARCYRYQSCEHPGWDASRANELVSKLIDTIDARHAHEREEFQARCDQGPWGIDNIEEAIAR